MASVKFQKGDIEYEVFNKIWQFWQSVGQPEHSDQYWMNVVEDARTLEKWFGGLERDLVNKLTVDIIDYLELKSRKQGG